MGLLISIPLTFVLGLMFFMPSIFIYWSKWIVSYIYIKLQRCTSKRRFDFYDYSVKDDPFKTNILIPPGEYALESPHPNSHLLKNKDEVFFYGTNSKSELLVVKINRRWNTRADACIYLKLESGKVYQLEKTYDFQQSCTDEMTFSCGGLQLQCTSPIRFWRLFYAGYLREITQDKPTGGEMVYVKFALLWRAASDVYDFGSDVSASCLADGLSKASWTSLHPDLSKIQKALDFYSQAGVIHGTVTVEGEIEDKEIYLFGQRIRYLGDPSGLKDMEFQHILGYVKRTGTYLHLGKISATNTVKDFCFGFAIQPDADLKCIKKASISICESNTGEKEILDANFKTDCFNYKLNGSTKGIDSLNVNCEDTGNIINWCEFDLNSEKGDGIQIKRTVSKILLSEFSEIHSLSLPSVVPPVLSFKDKICQLSEITGGKGSSLGKLTQLSGHLKTFIVPDGIVVTTSAYAKFITQNVLEKIIVLEQKLYDQNYKHEEVKEECKRVTEAIVETDFSNELREKIVKSMEINFCDKIHSHKFAVRSSATGEDTEQMSAAGQMETFLGISGIDEVLIAVKKCWASQFGFIAIEYKRRYGQKLNSPMAVVIQEMIPCDVAGVLFTCDPLTGNPTLMSITSNYGLGESVVSGSEEPDIIQLKRDENDKISITNITIGAKCRKITLEDKQGTNLTDVSESNRNICSLSEEQTLLLADLAIKIEKEHRSHRDIEWGIFNNDLYIFQSRPVTSGTKETLYEMEHEFDSPLRVENDYFSVSNVGEVLPGAMSALGLSVFMRAFRILLNSEKKETDVQVNVKTNYFSLGWLMMYNHAIFNVADVFHTGLNEEELSSMTKASIISFFGRIPENKDMFDVAKARYGALPKASPVLFMYNLVKTLFFSGKRKRATMKSYSDYRIPVEKYNSSKDLFDALLRTSSDIVDVGMNHMLCTQRSSIWNMIIFATLGAARGDFDDVVYNDFANLVKTDSEVESADVPSALQNLASYIRKGINPEEFRKMTIKDALKWLQTSETVAGEKFRSFIEKHGHRCLQEYDIYSYSWREDATPVVKSLQTLAGSKLKNVGEIKSDTLNIAISNLKVPLGFIAKLKLKFVLPLSRKAVQDREMTKSMFVKVVDEWRRGYRKLAKLMVKEGRIPEEDLLYFMTTDDVHNLLETYSPNIIARATRRKKIYPTLYNYRFPEIMKGLPRPINKADVLNVINEVNFSMKGIPVSQGVAKGFIRKAITLEEATEIKPNEILLTYSTDIGWTPYFPNLAGVVTELGGLISHGAVVSREYGIPCIAGLHGATREFQTGDYVLLDGNKGILQKLKTPES